MAVFGICLGSVYKVGDSAGWTIIGNVDYNTWASSKTFQIGDVVIFNYDAQFHNVLQVTLPEFHSCNSSSPIVTYSSGNDSITVTSPGHYYYICGFVGHCEAGQKVDIRVPKSLQPTAIPIAAPPGHLAVPETSPNGLITPSPSKNSAEQENRGNFAVKEAELIALREGLEFAVRLNFQLEAAEVDSLSIVQDLESDFTFSPLVELLHDVSTLIHTLCQAPCQYIPREGNCVAHELASVVCELSMAMGGIVYKVGDAAGWTNIANVDYKSWAAAKNFHVGDTIRKSLFLC
ncbi:Phytocyanin domain-containing protein [Forsythia ovata]|uniref:Phytocyanin domain-containing protein n=1 Tax=Forsythia ovata TaxID=205694 RepID=A0ABD1T4W4_9LAMI